MSVIVKGIVVELMTMALYIAKFVHELYDLQQIKDSNSGGEYHDYFVEGPDPTFIQTNNCLIIEESKSHPVFIIRTPLGAWQICGGIAVNDIKQLSKRIHEHITMEPLNTSGEHGSCWLVIAINDKSVNKETHLYKNLDDYVSHKEATRQFDALLQYWIINGHISDKLNMSLGMLHNDMTYNFGLRLYKTIIEQKGYRYEDIFLFSRLKQRFIFRAIYKSRCNDNSLVLRSRL
jgi:hypothetical protein